jgi:hypothetical protein
MCQKSGTESFLEANSKAPTVLVAWPDLRLGRNELIARPDESHMMLLMKDLRKELRQCIN